MNMRERCERAEAYRKNGGQLRPGAAGGIRRCDGYYGDPGTGCRCGIRRRRAKREHLWGGKRACDDPGLRVSGNGPPARRNPRRSPRNTSGGLWRDLSISIAGICWRRRNYSPLTRPWHWRRGDHCGLLILSAAEILCGMIGEK